MNHQPLRMSLRLLLLKLFALLAQAKGSTTNHQNYTNRWIGQALSPFFQVDQRQVHDLDQPLKAGVVEQSQVMVWESDYWIDNDGTPHLKPGLSQDIWGYIALHSGLKFRIHAIADDWGPSQTTNNSLVNMLRTGQIDVSFTNLAHCCDRYLFHDFTPIVRERDYVVSFYPAELENGIYIHIFAPSLWITLVIVLCLLLFIMYILMRIGNTSLDQGTRFSWQDCLSWIFCVASQQGYTKTPATLSGRVLFLVGFLTGTLVFQGFAANVITILSRSETINSLEALIEMNSISVYQSYFPPFQKELEDSKKPIVKDLVRKIKSIEPSPLGKDLLNSDELLMNQMVYENDPKMAFIGPELYLRDKQYFTFNHYEHLSCKLKWLLVPIGRQKVMYGVRKNLPQKKKLELAMFRFRETGLLQKSLNSHKPSSPKCESLNKFQSKVVSLNHVMGAYFLLFMGYIFSVMLLMTEKVIAQQAIKT